MSDTRNNDVLSLDELDELFNSIISDFEDIKKAILDKNVNEVKTKLREVLDINETDSDITRLSHACFNINYGDASDTTLLMYAADNSSKEIVDLLIANGADVNAKDKDGWTALMFAANRNDTQIAEILLDNGAEINQRESIDPYRTPLILAVQKNHVEMTEFLLKKGADPTREDNNRNTPLIIAIKKAKRTTDIVNLLIEKGAGKEGTWE